jgi:hypothetical protein
MHPSPWTMDLDLHVTLDGEEVQHFKSFLYLVVGGVLVFLLTRKPEEGTTSHWESLMRRCRRCLHDEPDSRVKTQAVITPGSGGSSPNVYRYVEMDSSSRHGSQHSSQHGSQHGSQHNNQPHSGGGVRREGPQVWTRSRGDPFP